jgi:hypothetical protein
MKSLLLFSLLMTSNLWADANKTHTIVTQTKIDLSNLFYSYSPVHYQDYSFPANLAHSYTLKTTYFFPENIKAKVTSQESPAGQSCSWYNVCHPFPAEQVAQMTFNDDRLYATWELIDDLTGKQVSVVKTKLEIQILKGGQPHVHINFEGRNAGKVSRYHKDNSQPTEIVLPNKSSLSLSGDFFSYRMEGASFDLKAIDSTNYKIIGLNFNQTAIKANKFSPQGVMLNFDRDRIGFYFSVGAPQASNPQIVEKFVSQN